PRGVGCDSGKSGAVPDCPRIHRRLISQTGRRLVQRAGSRRRTGSGQGVCRTESQPVIPSIVLLGNLLVDDVVLADGTTRMGQPGGSLLYNALGATLWNSRAGLVSVLGDDYPAGALEQLQRRGVDLTGVKPLGRPGVRTWLLHEAHVRRLIHRLGCPTHEEVSPRPDFIPSEWSAARAFHIAPMPLGVQRALLAA